MDVMLKTFFISFLFSGVACLFKWANDSKDGETIYACKGQTVTFPWSYNYIREAEGSDIKKQWAFFPTTSGKKMIAIIAFWNFMAYPNYAGRVNEMSGDSASLVLKNVTLADSGNYQVSITIPGQRSFVKSHKRATLVVFDTLPTKRGYLEMVRLNKFAVLGLKSEKVAIALGCGQFTFPDRPPFDVQWQLPSGEVVESDRIQNGNYILLLKAPVTEGTYKCYIPENDRDKACLASNDVSSSMASLQIGKTKVSPVSDRPRPRQQSRRAVSKRFRFDPCPLTTFRDVHLTVANMDADETESRRYEAIRNISEFRKDQNHFIPHDHSQTKNLIIPHVSFNTGLLRSAEIDENNKNMIVFTKTVVNKGQAFDPMTGYFTAPHPGEYAFSLTAKAVIGKTSTWIKLTHSGSLQEKTLCRAEAESLSSAACQATAYLNQGDKVWVQGYPHSRLHYRMSNFAGFLIADDKAVALGQ